MKKFITILADTHLSACPWPPCGGRGGSGGFDEKARILNQYYEDFMATLGADNTPAMMDLEGIPGALLPGLGEYAQAVTVLKRGQTSVPYESPWWSWRRSLTPRRWRICSSPH